MPSIIQQNLIPDDPQLIDVLNVLKKEISLNINCHHLGTIQSFNPLLQTATATINYQKTFFQFNSLTGAYVSMNQSYPVLADCPVILLGGGRGALTFPIQNGDECLILFNDRDMDNWFSGSSGSANATGRLHSFADGIILVGIRSMANVLINYDMNRVVLRNGVGGSTLVGIGETLIKIANEVQSLKSVLEGLTAKIDSVLATGTVSSAPGPVTFVGTVSSFNSTIEQLLE